jgi:membrane glycosyltransferase
MKCKMKHSDMFISDKERLYIKLIYRRTAFLIVVTATVLFLVGVMALTLFPSGIDVWGALMLLCFALTAPMTAIGFWHAIIGLGLMLFVHNPEAYVSPFLQLVFDDEPIVKKTALAICIRNEEVGRLKRNLHLMLNGLIETQYTEYFHLYILSDTSISEVAILEEQIAQELQDKFGPFIGVTYRRRKTNEGFKAGNIREFCEVHAADNDYLIVLDADSLMTPNSMFRLVRIMQNNARIGIVQTLVTGLPSPSVFARIFQFGMRLGMRSYTLGAASWQGDCGPYWGHNAIIRLEPFSKECALPVLRGGPPLGGHILSHDQIEAVLMRRAGYEVRIMPLEGGSYEETPPTLLEFVRRDLRWCQGNMQYFKLINLPHLYKVSRVQILLAIALYTGAPAWIFFTVFGLIRHAPLDLELGFFMLSLTLAMAFAPKLATLSAILVNRKQRQSFGGIVRILIGALIELIFSMLIGPIVAVSVTIFVLGLPFGRQIGWTTQLRDSDGISWFVAIKALWFHTLIGLGFAFWIWTTEINAWWVAAPFFMGLLTSIPFAVLTASQSLGRWFATYAICAIPEEQLAFTASAPSIFTPFYHLISESYEREHL